MTEHILLDPSEAISNREEFELTAFIDHEGIDWGEAAIDAVFGERERGEVPVDFRVPNRDVIVPLSLVARGTVTTEAARTALQAKVGLFQREGGVLRRITHAGGTVYADIVNASLTATSVSGWESEQEVDIDAQMSLTCLPDFYEAEQTLSDHTETTAAEFVFTETDIAGDYPARVRIVVDEDDADDQRGLIWGFRSRHYSSASTAALKYEAEALTALDTATKPALSGASGGTVVTHGTVSTSWTPVMSTNLAAGTYLTHTGSYRLWGRVYSTSGTTVQTRAVWDVGDLVNPVENDSYRLVGGTAFYLCDYGEVRLDPSPVGTHRWQGQVQAKGDAGGENFSVDKLWLQPLDEGAGKLQAPTVLRSALSTFSARSEFKTESGAITGDSLAVGGTWTAVALSDADDLTEAGDVVTRITTSDTGTVYTSGRLVYASTPTPSLVAGQIDIYATNAFAGAQGLILRRADDTNFLLVSFAPTGATGSGSYILVIKVIGGSPTAIISETVTPDFAYDIYHRLIAMVDAAGNVSVYFGRQGSQTLRCRGYDSALATGGTLDDGKVGFFDANPTATAAIRGYDNFAAWVPPIDAVMFASQSVQLTTDGIVREDSTGAGYGPVSIQAGDLPRLPVAGLEGRTTEVLIKSSRGDLDQLPDSHSSTDYGDNISARVTYRPCWLHVPGT